MSYWSHNIFGDVAAESRLFMIVRDSGIEAIPYGTVKGSAYSNPRTGKWPKGFVFYFLGKGEEYSFIDATGKGSTAGWGTR